MNNIFSHEVVNQNSSTSPVEHLANEVDKAFTKVSSIIGNNTLVPSLTKVLGNFVLADINYHGESKERTESFSMSKGTKDISLKYTPTESDVTISYIDDNNKTVFLTQKQPVQELKNTTDFKLLGKTIVLGGNFENKSLEVKYTGICPLMGDLRIKPNVLKDDDNTYLKNLVENSPLEYSLTYDVNLQERKETFINDGSEVFVIAKEGNEYEIIEYLSYTLEGNVLKITTEKELEKNYPEVLVYVLNTTVTDLLKALYYEFLNHSHDRDGSISLIDHKNILNNYSNTSTIFYKDSETVNYQHPQYLAREGYNSTVTSAYENGLLGDLLLSSVISESDQNFKDLSKNSYKILFGDPISGSKLYYDAINKNINLLSGTKLSGLNITVGTSKKGLSINNSTYILEDESHTVLRGKNDSLEVVGSLSTDVFKSAVSSQSPLVIADTLRVGKTTITSNTDSVEVVSDENSTLSFNTKTTLKDSVLVKSSVNTMSLLGSIVVSENSTLENSEGGFKFTVKDKTLDIQQNSGKNSGIKLLTQGNDFIQLFGSDSTGANSADATSQFYIQSTEGKKLILLQDSSKVLTKNGIRYSFGQDVENATKISELSKWLKSDLDLGKLSAYSGEFQPSNKYEKQGIKIADTKIYVIGQGLDCPEGSTLIESSNSVYFIKSLGDDQTDCKDISYQEVIVGDLQANGDFAVSGDSTIIGNLSVGEEVTATDVSVSGILTTNSLSVSENSVFTGDSKFNGSVSFISNITGEGSFTLKGSLSANNLNVDKYLTVGETLQVTGQTYLQEKLTVQSNATVEGELVVGTSVTSDSISTGDIEGSDIVAKGSLTVGASLKVGGKATIEGNAEVEGQIDAESVTASKNLTANSLYILTDSTFQGRFQVTSSSVTIDTGSLNIGAEGASLQLRGNLQVTGDRNTFTGSMTVLGDVVASSSLKVNSTLTVSGAATLTSLTVNSDAVVKGSLTASSGEFGKKVYFQDGINVIGEGSFTTLKADTSVLKDLRTNTLYIQDTLTMGPEAKIVAYYMETSNFLQKDPSGTNVFSGTSTFNNVSYFNEDIIIGNKDIKNKRNTSGCLISDDQIKMGNNSTIEAVKFFAGKGTPVGGNKDLNAGYTFASRYIDTGVDGDTGLFATSGDDTDLDGSDLEIWIDGVRKYSFSKEAVAYNETKEEARVSVVTLDMLQKMQADIIAKVEATLAATTSAAHPVGTIYLTMNDQNPYLIFNFGTWVRFSPGRTLVGRVTGNSNETGGTLSGGLVSPKGFDLKTAGSVYGEFEHELTKSELPNEPLELQGTSYHSWIGNRNGVKKYNIPNKDGNDSTRYYTKPMGDGALHNNVQPSTVVNMWHRIA